ncbi:MAG: hypothetical protein QOE35_1138 [Actinomycetota bacterium]
MRRVVRRVDTWTVLRFSALFYASLLIVFVVAGVLLWAVASITGAVGNIETFIKQLFALDSFHFVAIDLLLGTVLGGAVLVVLGTGLNLLMAVLYNLISDVVGGIEITVLEEDQGSRPVV